MVFIYVLKLRDNKYYVGKTLNPRFRIKEHFSSTGSKWTKKYKPIDLHQLIPDCDDFDEDKITIQMMQKYGISNVRGGSFSTSKLSKSDLSTINKMIKSSSDLCFNCNEYGHFASNCPKKYKKEKTDSSAEKSLKKYLTNIGVKYNPDITKQELINLLINSLQINKLKRLLIAEGIDVREITNITEIRKKVLELYDCDSIDESSEYTSDETIDESSDEYYVKRSNKCYRCGRKGHYASRCYAKRHISGKYLS